MRGCPHGAADGNYCPQDSRDGEREAQHHAGGIGPDGLIEKVAEGDDTLMERFFDQGGLSKEELLDGLKREVGHHQIFPVVLDSAAHNIGGHAILDCIVALLPPADELKTVDGKDIRMFFFDYDSAALHLA